MCCEEGVKYVYMNEAGILEIIKSDKWMMDILRIAEKQNLKDWIIGAGFVRNKVWDYLSGNLKAEVDTSDIDLVYFDPQGNDESEDEELSKKLQTETNKSWEIVNEYYAHKWNDLSPYLSTEDAISKWPETVTAIGVSMKGSELKLFAPYGIDDLVNFVVRPTPAFLNKLPMIKERVKKKRWQERWPQVSLSFEIE